MMPFLRSRAQRVAAVVVASVLSAVGFLPLFGGPGYEQALASGLVAPSVAAVATALELSAVDVSPLAAVGRGVLCGLALAVIALATALAHGLRVGVCDFVGGLIGFVLTAGFGTVLGGAWGACVAEIARGRRWRRSWCVVLGLAAPFAGVVVSLVRFYASPMIFAFDPFFGYFSGALYDTVIDTGTSLLTYRAGTLATLVGIALLASVLVRDERGRLRIGLHESGRGAVARLALAAAALTASLGVTLAGPSLGHWQTSATIADELGGLRVGARCSVVYPSTTRPDEADLLVKDCEEELAAVEGTLGARGPDRVTAIFFRDAAEKKRLMGAADTFIAKPWRKEVYLQVAPYPHPVLGHELAHVVAGGFGQGPFRVAGAVGGLLPNPGLIEGIAVAASREDDALTDAQWAHAMLDLKTLPPLREVFSLGFYGASAAKSYTIAGAFVHWAMGKFGAPIVRAWYSGASLEGLTHQSWGALEQAFREDASQTPLPPQAETYAKAKFEHPSVFRRKCPHEVDAMRHKADVCRESEQVAKAVELYDDALARDPHDDAAIYGRGLAQLRWGDSGEGRKELTSFADAPEVPRTWRDRSLDALADSDLLAGHTDAAVERYRSLATASLDEDFGRTEEVKVLAANDARGRAAIEALLVGTTKRPADTVLAAARLGAWAEATESPLALYLLGKNLALRGWYAEAAAYLDRARMGSASLAREGLEGSGETPAKDRIGREILRQRAICACALGDGASVRRLEDAVRDPSGPFASSEGRQEWVLALLHRCAPSP